MKKFLLSISFLFFTTILFGQEIRLSIGPTLNYTINTNKKDVIISTAASSIMDVGINSGLNYLFDSKDSRFRFGFGIGYQSNKISVIRGFEGSSDFRQRTDEIQLLSLDFRSMLSLHKRFYISFDPILDMQIGYDPEQYLDKQTGLGCSAGIGKDFPMTANLGLNIEPRLWIHNLIPFQNALPTRLITFGINVGLSFNNIK